MKTLKQMEIIILVWFKIAFEYFYNYLKNEKVTVGEKRILMLS